jgi:hypothetical protein
MERITDNGDRVGAFKRLLYVLVPLLALMLVTLGIAYIADVPVTDLLRDASAVLDGPWYAGIFSTTGIALWAAAGAMSLLALTAEPSKNLRSLLVATAVVSFMLGADDGYLIHETVKNEIGIPSPVTIGLYGIVAIIVFVPVWRYVLSRPDSVVIATAVALFAVSVILDVGGELGLPMPPLSSIIEDIAKFLGIATWTAYAASVARSAIREREGVAAGI